jgi:hypothetical protein
LIFLVDLALPVSAGGAFRVFNRSRYRTTHANVTVTAMKRPVQARRAIPSASKGKDLAWDAGVCCAVMDVIGRVMRLRVFHL